MFFWNESGDSTGVSEFAPGVHVKQLHGFIEKLVANPMLFERHSTN